MVWPTKFAELLSGTSTLLWVRFLVVFVQNVVVLPTLHVNGIII